MADKKYSLKERYAYHKEIADSGKMPDGSRVGLTTRVRHAQRANGVLNRLNTFMKVSNFCDTHKKGK